MKELSNLKAPKGATRPRHRVGRGQGSGSGKTAGSGHKGQNARSGKPIKAAFEGGQMPLSRRLPKRGFSNYPFGKVNAWINVGQLERFDAGTVVDSALLVKTGLVKGVFDGIKCLGNGELSKSLVVRLDAFSASAKTKIEAVNGKAEVIRGE
jgi:large subunit ribosomal protein L15